MNRHFRRLQPKLDLKTSAALFSYQSVCFSACLDSLREGERESTKNKIDRHGGDKQTLQTDKRERESITDKIDRHEREKEANKHYHQMRERGKE